MLALQGGLSSAPFYGENPFMDRTLMEEESEETISDVMDLLEKNPSLAHNAHQFAKAITEKLLGEVYQLIENPEVFRKQYKELRSENKFSKNPYLPTSAFENYDLSILASPTFDSKGNIVFFVTRSFVPYLVSHEKGTNEVVLEMLDS